MTDAREVPGTASSPRPYAPLTARFFAGVIDAALLTALALLAQLALRQDVRVPLAPLTVLSAAYFIFAYAAAGNGYSLGKRVLSIRVVNRQGESLSLPASAIRWLVLIGIALPLSLLGDGFERGRPLGVAPAMAIAVPVLAVVVVDSYLFLFNRRTRQSLHDLAAGSFVVRRAHAGPVPVAPLWRGHFGWIAACCVVVVAGFPSPYRWAIELVPRSAELLRARERILATNRVSGLIVSPGLATEGADTIWSVSVLARIHAAPRTEHEAESLRLALACALVREAPRTLRSAEVYLMVSFEPGAVKTAATTAYLVNTDLTASACAAAPVKF